MPILRQPWRATGMSGGSRGQSNPIGLILVLGLVVAGASAIVVLGASAMGDTQRSLSEQRAEKIMTQVDSKSALVALGNTETQRIALPRRGSETFEVHPGDGWMNITIHNQSSGELTTVVNRTLGEIVYENKDGTTISYQGGGVWRSSYQGDSIMISPPEFHYRGATLTLPIITVDGDATLTNRARITNLQETQYFPNKSLDSDFVNPLDKGVINVTVRSDHYVGWGGYFQQRTEGNVVYDHENQTVTAELVVPFDESFTNAVATTQENGITVNGNGDKPEPYAEGEPYPSVDERIEEQIDDCVSAGGCNTSWGSAIDTKGVFYTDTESDTSDWTVDSPGGNVTIVADTTVEARDIKIQDVADPYSVTIYARESVTVKDNVNENEGDASEFQVLVHSEGDVSFKGQSEFWGLVYAPESHCSFEGGGANDPNINGGVICETVNINGNANDIEYDPAIENTGLGLNPADQSYITYLHITENKISVRSG